MRKALPPILLLLAAPSLSQTSPDPASKGRGDGPWELVDGVAAQAGDRIIRTRAYLQRANAAREQAELRNRREERALLWGVLEELATDLLVEQAGADGEKNRGEVDSFIQNALDRRARDEGPASFAEKLSADGHDLDDELRKSQNEVYSSFWVDRKLGRANARGARPTLDRHVRPGKLKAIYHSGADLLDPSTAVLQFFILNVDAVGGVEEDARAYLEEIRARVLAGEDFGELIEENASMDRATRGLQPSQEIVRIPIAALREFALEGRMGDLSELVPFRQGTTPLLILARLVEKEAKPIPPFTDSSIQRILRQRLTNTRDQGILARERGDLLENSYTWYLPEFRDLRDPAEERNLGRDAPGR